MTKNSSAGARVLIALLSIVLFAAACSGGDDGGSEGSTDPGSSDDADGESDGESGDDGGGDDGGGDVTGNSGDADLGELPDFEAVEIALSFTPLGDCEVTPTEGTITLDFYSSSRGLAAGVRGQFDGTVYLGEGTVTWAGRPGHVTRDGVESTDADLIEWTFAADGVSGTWMHRDVDGNVETVGPTDGVCDEGGSFTGTSADYAQLLEVIDAAPALDQDVGRAEDLSCSATADGFLMAGRAASLPEGTSIRAFVSVEADGFVELDVAAATVGSGGDFEIAVPYDGGKTLVSLVVFSGVYSLGGNFFDECG